MKWTLVHVLLILYPVIGWSFRKEAAGKSFKYPGYAKYLDWRSCNFRKDILPCLKLDWRTCDFIKCIKRKLTGCKCFKNKNRCKRQFPGLGGFMRPDAGRYSGNILPPWDMGYQGSMGFPWGNGYPGVMGFPWGNGYPGSIGFPGGMDYLGGTVYPGGTKRPCVQKKVVVVTTKPIVKGNYGSCPPGYKLCACKICNKRRKYVVKV